MRIRKLPTDREVLECIYDLYLENYISFDPENSPRKHKNFVPVNVKRIAEMLRMPPDLVFDRLYYHLEKKYGYEREPGKRVPFFTIDEIPGHRHCVNFPVLASVVATLKEERSALQQAQTAAWISTLVAVFALVLTVLGCDSA